MLELINTRIRVVLYRQATRSKQPEYLGSVHSMLSRDRQPCMLHILIGACLVLDKSPRSCQAPGGRRRKNAANSRLIQCLFGSTTLRTVKQSVRTSLPLITLGMGARPARRGIRVFHGDRSSLYVLVVVV